ncbi:MAG TPA: hypothetical protein VGO40_08145, partial [Longimicrobium sp.]|nr:hypothetical protein [Longimicrobium sp.]
MSTAAVETGVAPGRADVEAEVEEPLEDAGPGEGFLATLASRSLAGGAWALLTVGCNLGLGMARTLVV